MTGSNSTGGVPRMPVSRRSGRKGGGSDPPPFQSIFSLKRCAFQNIASRFVLFKDKTLYNRNDVSV